MYYFKKFSGMMKISTDNFQYVKNRSYSYNKHIPS
jgi:hypothetical protein